MQSDTFCVVYLLFIVGFNSATSHLYNPHNNNNTNNSNNNNNKIMYLNNL
jgi:hypothetical protein